jgi:hypothetical protein
VKTQRKIRRIGCQIGLTDSFTPKVFTEIGDELTTKQDGLLHYKTTKQLIGFIVYVAQTYTALVPYLKGIYLTLNLWRKGRDAEEWMTAEGLKAARLGLKEPDGDHPE